MELTKEDIRSMKKADTVVARYDGATDKSTLEVIVEDRKSGDEKSRTNIPVSSSLAFYSKVDDGEILSASAVCLYARHADGWSTMMNVIRPGDELTVLWIAGNDSQVLRQAGLHHDQCKIMINRRTKTTSKKFVFELYDSISPDNTARMFKTTGAK